MAFREVVQPKNFAERAALAKKAMQELKLPIDVWIDDQGDQSRAMFGDLPHSAIVIDPVGTVRLKLSWCDPKVLDFAIREVPVVSEGKKQAPVEAQFFDRITAPTATSKVTTHHRRVMLGYLVTRDLCTTLRNEWLEELAGTGPQQQRRWAKGLLRVGADMSPKR